MGVASRSRQSGMSAVVWPGFVDAMTTLLMILMFVLSVFMILQFSLRATITNKENELADLSSQVAGLADALGLARDRNSALTGDLAAAEDAADAQARLIATLTGQVEAQGAALNQAEARITSFEAQVATLLSERDTARGQAADLTAERDRLVSDAEALNLALAKARDEIDAGAEAARLAAARREAAKLLRDRLKGAETELTAMTLALEEQRKRAEDTLTLLAAADAARKDLDTKVAAALLAQTASEEQLAAARAAAEAATAAGDRERADVEAELAAALAAKLAAANTELASEKAISAEAARKVALLNQQVAALRTQLGSLQVMLDASAAQDADAKVQIEALGSQLNSALARVAAEERRRAELEEAERKRLEAEAAALKESNSALTQNAEELARYRSEFFGKLSAVLAGREGVRVVGDRFVFSSEVLFTSASADLAPEGKAQIAGVVATLQEVAAAIPPELDWIIRVDGHTDATPLSGGGRYADNWELSQARALSVVRYMQEELGFPPERLAATGFGEYRPVAEGDSEEALAANRRIELKLTER
jgi:chemotaxis protein MotB